MLFSQVKISSFCAKAHLVFHWCLYINTSTFIHSHSSLENHAQFQTKMGKFIPAFRPKRPQNHTLWVSAYLHGLYKGVPPHPPLRDSTKSESWAVHTFLKNLTKYYMPSNSLQKTKLLLHDVPSHFQISLPYHTRLKQLQVQWLCVQNCMAGEHLHLSQCLWSLIDPVTV